MPFSQNFRPALAPTLLFGLLIFFGGCTASAPAGPASRPARVSSLSVAPAPKSGPEKVQYSVEEWRKRLDAQSFHVLREQGTERPFSGAHWDEKRPGLFRCKGCGQVLFNAKEKFKSGTGWPSFWQPYQEGLVKINVDRSLGMERKEVVCARCGGHLGHVFSDGPQPTGLRYCINSASLDFEVDSALSKPAK